MSKTLCRALCSAALLACFAFSAVTLGAMPGCAPTPAQSAAAGHSGHQDAHHHGSTPASSHCVIHLCCANVALTATVGFPGARSAPAPQGFGFRAVAAITPILAAHILPFAHAPPSHSA